MAFLCINLPHTDVYVKKEYLYDLQKGHGELTEGVWVTVPQVRKPLTTLENQMPAMPAPESPSVPAAQPE